MPKMTDQEIEHSITQAHADVLAHVVSNASEREKDRGIVCALRATFVTGTGHGRASVLDAVTELMGPRAVDAAAAQLARSVATVVQWCEEGDEILEIRSYSVRRSAYLDPEKKWVATGASVTDSSSKCHYGASHAEALARLATWCQERLNHDEKTDPNNEIPDPFPTVGAVQS